MKVGGGGTGRFWAAVVVLIAVMAAARGCRAPRRQDVTRPPHPPAVAAADGEEFLVTGYCNCGRCCGWKRSWLGFGRPVYDYGPMKGQPKKIGVTASGTKAKRGTIAADPKRFRFGTHLAVPGYGTGTVEDVGGSIKGRHIDIWFPTHEEARRWGTRRLKIRVVR